MRRRVACLLLASALVAPGCGEDEATPAEQARSTAEAFGKAVAAKDYAALCDRLFGREILDSLQNINLPCRTAMERAFGGLREPKLTIGKVRVSGERASVEVRSAAAGQAPSQDVLQLAREDGKWRISQLEGAAPPAPEATPTP